MLHFGVDTLFLSEVINSFPASGYSAIIVDDDIASRRYPVIKASQRNDVGFIHVAIEMEQRDAIYGSRGQRITIPSPQVADLVVAESIAFEILLYSVLRDYQFTERAVWIILVRGIRPWIWMR